MKAIIIFILCSVLCMPQSLGKRGMGGMGSGGISKVQNSIALNDTLVYQASIIGTNGILGVAIVETITKNTLGLTLNNWGNNNGGVGNYSYDLTYSSGVDHFTDGFLLSISDSTNYEIYSTNGDYTGDIIVLSAGDGDPEVFNVIVTIKKAP